MPAVVSLPIVWKWARESMVDGLDEQWKDLFAPNNVYQFPNLTYVDIGANPIDRDQYDWTVLEKNGVEVVLEESRT